MKSRLLESRVKALSPSDCTFLTLALKKKISLSYHQTAIKAKNDWDILHKVLTLEWGF